MTWVTLSANDNELMGVRPRARTCPCPDTACVLSFRDQSSESSQRGLSCISSAIAAAPAALLQANYSREFEREADDFAARMLENNGISPQCLADILMQMEKTNPETATSKHSATFSHYLQSHPATTERVEVLRGKPCE